MADLREITVTYNSGYFNGGHPSVSPAKPADVCYDKSNQTIWVFNGRTWVPQSYNSTFTLRLGKGVTVKQRLASKFSYIPDKISAYIGNDDNVIGSMRYSDKDIVINVPVQSVLIKVYCYVKDPITSLVHMVDVNPKTMFLSKGWIIVKDFIETVGYDELIMVIETSGGHDLVPIVPPVPDDMKSDLVYDLYDAAGNQLEDDDSLLYDIIWSSDTGFDSDSTLFGDIYYEEVERQQ
jgi:hypothetical protein